MKLKTTNRRELLKLTGMSGISLAGAGILNAETGQSGTGPRNNKVITDKAIATLIDGSELATPFWRIESGKDGPSLLLIAAQHGNEVQGTEVSLRFKEICARQLAIGTVWIIPMAELRAIRERKYTIESTLSERNAEFAFHRAWPGDPEGNDTERVAYSLDQAVVRHCSHAMDMHCWEHYRAAETFVLTNQEVSKSMGEITTSRFMSYRKGSAPENDSKLQFGPLMFKRGAACTVMELSGQYQMQERQVRIGLSSMVNIAKILGMIEGEPELLNGSRAVKSAETTHEVLAPGSGMFMPALRKDKSDSLMVDDFVEKGQELGHILRDSDLVSVPFHAPESGYLFQLGLCHWALCDDNLPAQHPYTEEGETVAQVVTV